LQNKKNDKSCQVNYTKIPNDILDKIADLGVYNYSVASFIFRKTIGFQKMADDISVSQIKLGTGIGTRKIIYCVKVLQESGYISKSKGKINSYRVAKRYADLLKNTYAPEDQVSSFSHAPRDQVKKQSAPRAPKVIPMGSSASAPGDHTKETNINKVKERSNPPTKADSNHHKIVDDFAKGSERLSPGSPVNLRDQDFRAIKRMIGRCAKYLKTDKNSIQVYEMIREKMRLFYQLSKSNDKFFGTSGFSPSFLDSQWSRITETTIQALETPQQKHDREWAGYLDKPDKPKAKVIPFKKMIAADNGHGPNPHGAYAK